jgi:hypothetical protein
MSGPGEDVYNHEARHYLMIKSGRVVGHIAAFDGEDAVTLKNNIDRDALLVCFVHHQDERLLQREVAWIEAKVHG